MIDTRAIAVDGIGFYSTYQTAVLGFNVFLEIIVEPDDTPHTFTGGGGYAFGMKDAKRTHNIIRIIVHFMGDEEEFMFRVPIEKTEEVKTELIQLFLEKVNIKCDLFNINRLNESQIKIYTRFEGKI